VVICLELGAHLHTAQLMPLPLTVSCFSKIQIGFTFLVPAHPGIVPEKGLLNVCSVVVVTKFIIIIFSEKFYFQSCFCSKNYKRRNASKYTYRLGFFSAHSVLFPNTDSIFRCFTHV